jgi:hypothetical protein
MRIAIAATLALAGASSLEAQSVPSIPDLTTATPLGGSWSWAQTADGSESVFTGADSRPQITVHCTRLTRRVSLARPATAATPFLGIWTSSQTRNLPASFDPATNKLSAALPAFDNLLDAFASSRGRVGLTIPGAAPIVAPAWAEIARVVEDCRT